MNRPKSKLRTMAFDVFPAPKPQAQQRPIIQHRFIGTPRPQVAPPVAPAPKQPAVEWRPPATVYPHPLINERGQIVATAGQQHHPRPTSYLGKAIFHRCRCGFLIVQHRDSGWLFWVPVNPTMPRRIETLEQLTQAVGSDCWARRQAAAVKPEDESQRRLA
jgi:hypothetical protein